MNFINDIKNWPAILLTVICLILAALVQSRSFVIGFSVSILFIIISNPSFSLNRKRLLIAFGFLLSLGIFLSFFTKVDSSLGRILIYKISFKILIDHYLFGVGLGKFPVVYGEYQIEYFKIGGYTTKELLLADNTKHAFNDYLQFVIETGVIGFVFLIFMLSFIVKSIFRSLEKHPKPSTLLMFSIVQLISISTAAIFMHILEKAAFQLLFVTAASIVIYHAFFFNHNILKGGFFAAVIYSYILYSHYGFYLSNYKYYKELKQAKESFQTGYIREAFRYYKNIAPYFDGDVHFLTEYANVLCLLNYNREAENIMQKVVKMDNANVLYHKLADCYFKNGKLREAEETYIRAVYRVPNRFNTRFSLFNFYIMTGQFDKASVTGKAILVLPIKIPSEKVQLIRRKVAVTLSDCIRAGYLQE